MKYLHTKYKSTIEADDAFFRLMVIIHTITILPVTSYMFVKGEALGGWCGFISWLCLVSVWFGRKAARWLNIHYLLLGLFILVSGCSTGHTKSSPVCSDTIVGKSDTPNYSRRGNVYERYIEVHRVELIFEFGREPTYDEIQDWDKRLCEWDMDLCG
jgi:hypothetical protein